MAETWIYEKRGDIGVVMDENGLLVCMRVSEKIAQTNNRKCRS